MVKLLLTSDLVSTGKNVFSGGQSPRTQKLKTADVRYKFKRFRHRLDENDVVGCFPMPSPRVDVALHICRGILGFNPSTEPQRRFFWFHTRDGGSTQTRTIVIRD